MDRKLLSCCSGNFTLPNINQPRSWTSSREFQTVMVVRIFAGAVKSGFLTGVGRRGRNVLWVLDPCWQDGSGAQPFVEKFEREHQIRGSHLEGCVARRRERLIVL